MWRESSRSELVQEYHGKSGGICRITCTVSTGENVDSHVEVMWRESSRSELVQEYHGKSGGICRITCTVSTG